MTEMQERVPVTWHDAVPRGLPLGSHVLLSEQLTLPPDPRNVAVARAWIAERLPGWSSDSIRDAAALLTSELVTNAVVHARTELRVGIAVADEDVLIGVHDLDLGHREADGTDRHGGWGLSLVGQVASDWGQVQHPGGGKTVWFRMSR